MQQDTTQDGLLNKRVTVEQPTKGFRIAIDTIFLAAAVPARAGQRVLDMGCGVGGALLCLAARVPGLSIDGIEVQPELAQLCQSNILRNQGGDCLRVIEHDVLTYTPPHPYDHVMMNPPYHDAARHDGPDNPQKLRAHMIDNADMQAWIEKADQLAGDKGTITIIHRADRQDELVEMLSPRRPDIRIIPLLPKVGVEPKRIIIRAQKGGACVTICQPLVLHQADGKYTTEADTVLRDVAAIGFIATL